MCPILTKDLERSLRVSPAYEIRAAIHSLDVSVLPSCQLTFGDLDHDVDLRVLVSKRNLFVIVGRVGAPRVDRESQGSREPIGYIFDAIKDDTFFI